MRYALVNDGSQADKKAFPLLAEALNLFLKQYAADKRLDPSEMECQSFSSIDLVPPGWIQTLVQQTLDVADAAAYHDRDAHGKPIIRCGYGIIPGGELFHDKNGRGSSLLGEMEHEAAETEGDEGANQWVDLDVVDPQNPHSVFHIAAKEEVDPIQETFDTFMVNGTKCDRTNYVLNEWYNGKTPKGTKVDRMGVLHGPGAIGPGGYCIVRRAIQRDGEVFAAALRIDHRDPMSEWRLMKKAHKSSRTQYRLNQILRIG
jgi:hypothetical protein